MLNRRELLAAGAAAAASLRLAPAARGAEPQAYRIDFAAAQDGDGWPGWMSPGVANLRRAGGQGLLEAGSDVFPCDPRPVAFLLDHRQADVEIAANVVSPGAGAGLVLRRTGPRDYFAAVYDSEQGALLLLRRSPDGVAELARAPVNRRGTTLWFRARGTELAATFGDAAVQAAAPRRAGDPGVLATARTLFPSSGPPVLPALGNLHLLPYGVQEGQAFIESPVGQALMGRIREQSTAVFAQIEIRGSGPPRPTRPSVVAAGNGRPVFGGATVRVATDIPARVQIEVSADPRFRKRRKLPQAITGDFHSVIAEVDGLKPGQRAYWRPRLRRKGRESVGPVREFTVLPRKGTRERFTIAIGSCAAQFGPAFDQIAQRRPDVFIWQGDLNYPDTLGPLAQTVPAYAGIWRDFLANPKMAPIIERGMFAVQRDDHDYGLQDANATNLVEHGLAPWEALMERRTYYRFEAGQAGVWVLDQRLHKSDPAAPDGPEKTLLGAQQREWLLRTLSASKARFKVICSPCTLAPLSANARDGSWAAGFTAERDLLLDHIRTRVGGRTIFVTGDTHWTMVYDRDGLFEARPCPLGIPTPNDITLTQPQAAEDARRAPGVAYADDDRGHFAFLTIAADLDLEMVREDGHVAYRTRFAS
jgi:hypothetical protein